MGGALLQHLFQFRWRDPRTINIFQRRRLARNWPRSQPETPAGQARERHAHHPRKNARLKSIARAGRNFRFVVDPALASSSHVSIFKIFASELPFLCGEFDHRFGQLHAGGPGFIYSRSRQNVRASRTFADAGIAVSREERFALTPRLLQRLGAPRLQGPAVEMPPQIRMKDEVLQIAICSANRTAEPGRHEDAHRSHAIWMNVEESKNLRLRESDGVQDRARLKSAIFAEFDHHLHSQRPFAGVVAGRNSEVRVDLAPDGSDGAITNDGERGAQIHAGRETCFWMSLKISSLIGEAHTCNSLFLDQWFGDWHARPDLHHS